MTNRKPKLPLFDSGDPTLGDEAARMFGGGLSSNDMLRYTVVAAAGKFREPIMNFDNLSEALNLVRDLKANGRDAWVHDTHTGATIEEVPA